MRRLLPATALMLLVGCGTTESTPFSTIGEQLPTSSVEPTESAEPTPRPTPANSLTPRPSPPAGLAEACAAIAEFRESGTLITRLAEAAFESYETGDYDPWQAAAGEMNDQFEQLTTLLDDVPNEAPYADWKRSALTIMIALSSTIVAYDTGITDQDFAQMEDGNELLGDAANEIAAMNQAASAFEADC